MRVMWLNHKDIAHPTAGGAERLIHEVAAGLSRLGNENWIVSGSWPGARTREDIDSVHIRRFPTNFAPHLVYPLLANQLKIDIVVDSLAHAIPWVAPYLTSVPHVALFVHRHARTLPTQVPPIPAKLFTAIERNYSRIYKGTKFATISESSREDLEELGIPRRSIQVILPGVNHNLFYPRKPTPTASMVQFSGIRPYKRPEVALEVLRRLLREGVDAILYIVGDGPDLSRLRKTAEPLGGSVLFLGRLGYEELAGVVGSAWVHLQCSMAEGWGLAAIEAAACGTPTVAFRVPGSVDSVESGTSGFLVADGDVEAMVTAAKSVIEGGEAIRGRCLRYAERFSWDRTIESWHGFLQAELDDRGKGMGRR
jgi:glycosyltransferase involved in cell wall biosynthesis